MFAQKGNFYFIENKGQLIDQNGDKNNEVNYFLPLNESISIQLRPSGFSYDTRYRTDSRSKAFQRVDVNLLGANSNPEIEVLGESSDYINYYTSGLTDNSAFKTRHYQTVIYKDVYPSIDIRFTTSADHNFKFDFILRPGAELQDIRLEYSGFDEVKFDDVLELNLTSITLYESIPKSWMEESGEEVTATFKLVSQSNKSLILGYHVDSYNSINTLIIDPVLELAWSTYYGDTLTDIGVDVMTDNVGKVYMTGYTQSINNLATSGIHQDTLAGGLCDAFILKTDEDGNRLWSTYYGGSGADLTNAIMVDTFFNVTITGTTDSPNGIASDSCYQNALSGLKDAFIAQFNQNGLRNWSTYFGGLANDNGAEVDTDYDGYVYVSGKTESATNIAIGPAHQPSIAGLSDGFIVKLDTFGFPIWSTYYGGSDEDELVSVAQEGNQIVVSGNSKSTNNIATVGSFQEVYSDSIDAFIALFDQNGVRSWGTYIGNTALDKSTDVEIYNTKIFLTGLTQSDTSIATFGAHKETVDSTDAYLMKFDTLGNLIWGTYFGGESYDEGLELGVELDSNVYLFGNTHSISGIASYDNYDTTYSAQSDGFIAKFHHNGYFLHASYYGGEQEDHINGGDVYGNTAIYVCGTTQSADSIEFNSNIQEDLAGMEDGFLARFNTKISTIGTSIITTTGFDTICQDTFSIMLQDGALGQGANWVWYEGGCGVDGTQIAIGDTLVYYPPLGLVSLYVRGESVNNSTDCAFITFSVVPKPQADITVNDSVLCLGQNLELSSPSADSYSWSGPDSQSSNDQIFLVDTVQYSGSGYYHLTVDDGYGCSDEDSILITVLGSPNVSSTITNATCGGLNDGTINVIINGIDPLVYNWLNYAADTLFMESLFAGVYVIEVGDSNGCLVIDSITVNEPASFINGITLNNENCMAQDGSALVDVIGDEVNYQFLWLVDNSSSNPLDSVSQGTYYVTVTDTMGCFFTDSVIIENQNLLMIDSTTLINESCFDSEDGQAEVFASGGNAPYIYLWNPNGEVTSLSDSLSAGVYSVLVTDQDGCERLDSITITSYPEIVITIDSLFDAICGDKNGSIFTSVAGGSGDFEFEWSPTYSDLSYVEYLLGGAHTLVVTDSLNCESSIDVFIENIPPPSLDLSASLEQIQIGENTTLEASVSPTGAYVYSWAPASSLDCDDCLIVEGSPTESTYYSVLIEDENGCEVTDSIFIDVILCQSFFLPTIFSPNKDLLNDEWNVLSNCMNSFKLEVFDRWGEKIFQTESQELGWDGSYKGKVVDNGSYVYQLELVYENGEKESKSGSVKVAR